VRYVELRSRLCAISPLISHVVNEQHAFLRKRPVDMRWYYSDVVPISCAGFNPLSDTIFYGRHSHTEKLIEGSNEPVGDSINTVLYEILFCVHDYLHIWAVQRAIASFPQCYNPGAFEDQEILADLSFILILSEVVATVTLDWWLLPTLDLQRNLGIRNTFSAVTTPIGNDSIEQISSGAGVSITRQKSFFLWMATGYFSGRFHKLGKKPRQWLASQSWFIKEMQQSVRQRELVRSWLAHISGLPLLDEHFMNIPHTRGERAIVVDKLASEMWNVVRDPSLLQRQKAPIKPVNPPNSTDVYDFRFIDILHIPNLNAAAISSGDATTENFAYLAAQYVSLFDKDEYPNFEADDFDDCVRRKDWKKLTSVFGALPPSPPNPNPSLHLFLPN
jgi:hypothetical protein